MLSSCQRCIYMYISSRCLSAIFSPRTDIFSTPNQRRLAEKTFLNHDIEIEIEVNSPSRWNRPDPHAGRPCDSIVRHRRPRGGKHHISYRQGYPGASLLRGRHGNGGLSRENRIAWFRRHAPPPVADAIERETCRRGSGGLHGVG